MLKTLLKSTMLPLTNNQRAQGSMMKEINMYIFQTYKLKPDIVHANETENLCNLQCVDNESLFESSGNNFSLIPRTLFTMRSVFLIIGECSSSLNLQEANSTIKYQLLWLSRNDLFGSQQNAYDPLPPVVTCTILQQKSPTGCLNSSSILVCFVQ